MRIRHLSIMLSASVLMLAAPAVAQSDFEPVTDDMLANPAPADWLSYGRGIDNYRYSPLEAINRDNVGGLQLVWARAMEPGYNQIAPLAYNGVLYYGNPGDVIQAVDAATGDLIWEHRRILPQGIDQANALGERKRGIALYEDKIYFVSWDNNLVALDAQTGQVVFEHDRGQGAEGVSNATGPIVANGVVIAGSTCQYSAFGCYTTGHDASTGEELWRKTFIPQPGEEGDDTWAGAPMESRWMTGQWGQITYDPEVDLVYFGSSATGPASETQRGTPGGTQYGTNTRFAVNPRTGEEVWRHQTLPRDNWDQECTFEMINARLDLNPSSDMDGLLAIGPNATGERLVHVGVPCKTGTLWAFDAEDGEFLYARDTNEQDIIASIDDDGTVHVNEDKILGVVGEEVFWCPSHNGGRDWPPSSFNPESKVMFVPMINVCQYSTPIDQEFSALDVYNVDQTRVITPGFENAGRVDAINLETGETVWTWETLATTYSPTMITAGGLLFTGDTTRNFYAIDQESGDILWQTRLGSQAQGHAITYEVDGRQYIAMPAGGGGGTFLPEGLDFTQGSNMMYVFALPES